MPGPRTALIAGTAMWLFAFVWSLINNRPYHIFPDRVMAMFLPWALVESNLCALLGGWLYGEG